MTDKIKRRITIELEGNEEGDINMALDEVVLLIKADYTSGFDGNETDRFQFETFNITSNGETS